ncbi:MAG: mechanosensitive ion channel family protein [Pseudomonadota bacterium]
MTRAFAQTSPNSDTPDNTNAAGGTDVPGEIDVSTVSILERLDSWVDGSVKLVPNIITAIIVIAVFYVLGLLVRRAFMKWAHAKERNNLGRVFGSFLKYLVVSLGILLGLTIVVPTLNPGDLIAGLGVGSVAIGFAFKDILQNWLAGMLLLFRQPFEVGDQIIAQGYEGTVERIETRATVIKTYDGRVVLIPNSDVYTNAVLVNTAYETRRSQYDVGIGYGDDIAQAMEVMRDATAGVDGVEQDPAPEVLAVALADFSVVLRVRWWTDSKRSDVILVQSNVITAVKLALDKAGIDMPYETQVHLFHDQTEDVDGDRTQQREGWPALTQGKNPKPRAQSKKQAA